MSSSITDPKTDAASAQPGRFVKQKKSGGNAPGDGAPTVVEAKRAGTPSKLTARERVLAFVTLILWLNLFAGGMLVDTQPYRCAISWGGIAPVHADPKRLPEHPCYGYWTWDEQKQKSIFNRPALRNEDGSPSFWQPVATWLVPLIFFTPLNLAFISAAAGALGTLGSIANLNADPRIDDKTGPDPDDPDSFLPRDRTNPLLSGLLRGVFVYLFVISGMLLFDDSPTDTGANQYVRLAGFLSLFSFFVNYKPSVFTSMLDGAQKLISARGKAAATDDSAEKRFAEQFQALERKIEQAGAQRLNASITPEGKLDISMGQKQERADTAAVANAQSRHAADADADEPSRNGHSNGNGTGGAAD